MLLEAWNLVKLKTRSGDYFKSKYQSAFNLFRNHFKQFKIMSVNIPPP
jgi:hypothetical protein